MSNIVEKFIRISPNSGDTVQLPDSEGDLNVVLAPVADLAALTISWPLNPHNNQEIAILSTNNIAALSHINGTLNSLFPYIKAGGSYGCTYDQPGATYMASAVNIFGAPAVATPLRTLNNAFQVSAAQNALVVYSVDITATMSLTSGQVGRVYLQQADDAGFTQNLKNISRAANGNSGALTLGLALTQIGTAVVQGFIAAGKWARLMTENVTGSPTFAFIEGQETLLPI